MILCTTSTQDLMPDIVYVLINLSLRFCVPPVHKISCDFAHALHVVSDFEYIGTHPLNMPVRLSTKKNYKSNPYSDETCGPL